MYWFCAVTFVVVGGRRTGGLKRVCKVGLWFPRILVRSKTYTFYVSGARRSWGFEDFGFLGFLSDSIPEPIFNFGVNPSPGVYSLTSETFGPKPVSLGPKLRGQSLFFEPYIKQILSLEEPLKDS